MNKYQRHVPSTTIDIYDILNAYKVTCPATQHAVKKLLQPGERGHKDKLTDLREALASVKRAIDMEESEQKPKRRIYGIDYGDAVASKDDMIGVMRLIAAEAPHRQGSRGNAPGHGHSVPGIWDDDNGELAGKECGWCKAWNLAIDMAERGELEGS